MKSERVATQNHTRIVNNAKRLVPSTVTVRLKKLRLALRTGVPWVMNRIGREIKAAKRGTKAFLTKKSFIGTFDASDRIMGIAHISAKMVREGTKSDATIMNNVTASFAIGFMDCKKPFLLLTSST
jgi:hypothetical protein